jgi:hypothetical protein
MLDIAGLRQIVLMTRSARSSDGNVLGHNLNGRGLSSCPRWLSDGGWLSHFGARELEDVAGSISISDVSNLVLAGFRSGCSLLSVDHQSQGWLALGDGAISEQTLR